jgi:hypothetical protein
MGRIKRRSGTMARHVQLRRSVSRVDPVGGPGLRIPLMSLDGPKPVHVPRSVRFASFQQLLNELRTGLFIDEKPQPDRRIRFTPAGHDP